MPADELKWACFERLKVLPKNNHSSTQAVV